MLIHQNKIDWNYLFFVEFLLLASFFLALSSMFFCNASFFFDNCLNVLQKHPLNFIFNSSDSLTTHFFFIFFYFPSFCFICTMCSDPSIPKTSETHCKTCTVGQYTKEPASQDSCKPCGVGYFMPAKQKKKQRMLQQKKYARC